MKMIDGIIDALREEVEGASDYAEKYLKAKSKGDTIRANKYKEMANDELKHAEYLHNFAVQDVEELTKVYPLPENVESKWEHSHKRCAEKMALVRQMLSM